MYTFAQNGVQYVRDGELGANVFQSMEGSANFTVDAASPLSVTSAMLTIVIPRSGLSETQQPEVLSGVG